MVDRHEYDGGIALFDAIVSRFGSGRIEVCQPAVDGLHQALEFADYHRREISLIVAEIDDISSQFYTLMVLNETALTEPGSRFRALWHEAAAHMLASARCAHSLTDLTATIGFHALGLGGLTGIGERGVSVASVSGALRRLGASRNLVESLEGLVSSVHGRYIADLVNRSKHRAAVPMSYHIRRSGGAGGLIHEPMFGAFEGYDEVLASRFFKEYEDPLRGDVIQALKAITQEVLAVEWLNAHCADPSNITD